MVIPYLKETGAIKTPILTSDIPLTLEDILGEEEGKIYATIYDVINIKDNADIFYNIKNYYVDTDTKELRKKPEISYNQEIVYI